MAKFPVVDLDGKKLREIELSDVVFGAEPNPHLFYEVVKFQQINRRRGTVGVKNTSLVRGGGKKPYKQKGTGRARQGSIRASQWVGGGKAMAPKARDYSYRPPRKVPALPPTFPRYGSTQITSGPSASPSIPIYRQSFRRRTRQVQCE